MVMSVRDLCAPYFTAGQLLRVPAYERDAKLVLARFEQLVQGPQAGTTTSSRGRLCRSAAEGASSRTPCGDGTGAASVTGRQLFIHLNAVAFGLVAALLLLIALAASAQRRVGRPG
jgi:hypothetical protein